MRIARPLRDLEAVLEVAVGAVILPQVGVRDAEVGVGNGAAVLVVRGAVRFERALVVGDGLGQIPLDVGQDPQVLLHPRAQLAALASPLQRLHEVPPGILDCAGLHVQPAERVQRFPGEHLVAGVAGDAVAAAAQLPRFRRLVAVLAQHRQPSQRLGQHDPLARALGRGDRRLIDLHRFGNAPGPLPGPRVLQQVRRGAHRRARTRLPGSGDGNSRHDRITRQSRSRRND